MMNNIDSVKTDSLNKIHPTRSALIATIIVIIFSAIIALALMPEVAARVFTMAASHGSKHVRSEVHSVVHIYIWIIELYFTASLISAIRELTVFARHRSRRSAVSDMPLYYRVSMISGSVFLLALGVDCAHNYLAKADLLGAVLAITFCGLPAVHFTRMILRSYKTVQNANEEH